MRVRYQERQPLTAADLAAEQDHRLEQRHRHDSGQHRWGIVSGLALSIADAGVLIQPGFAVDGHGRGLHLSRPGLIRFDDLGAATGVWLSFRSGDAGDRRPDGVVVELTPGGLDPRRPPTGEDWPIYLGAVTRAGGVHEAHADRRPYAGLTGAAVTAPDRRARIEVGAGFAVAVDGTDRLTVDRAGAVSLIGHTVVDGPLDVPAVRFGPAAAPEGPRPWRVYRAAEGARDRLRFEIGNPGRTGSPALHSLAVGRRDGAFQPVLTTNARGDTTFHGDLTVRGGIVEGPVRADLSDPRLGALLVRTWSTASATAGLEVDERYRSALSVEVQPAVEPLPVSAAKYTITVRNTGATSIGAVFVAGFSEVDEGERLAVLVDNFGELAVGAAASKQRTVTGLTGPRTIDVVLVAAGVGRGGQTGSLAIGFVAERWQVTFKEQP